MAAYLLQDLVFVREHREEKAGKAVSMARRVVVEAEQLVARREKELEDFKVWRAAEETRLMDSIMLKPVKLGDISDMRLEIAGMREKELDYMDLLRKAEGDLDKAREALEAARRAHIKATQELEKLVEHRQLWQREQALEEERQADLELEDFISPKKNLLNLSGSQNHEYN
jgi:hypothetical protein